jgi:hypothetical protein
MPMEIIDAKPLKISKEFDYGRQQYIQQLRRGTQPECVSRWESPRGLEWLGSMVSGQLCIAWSIIDNSGQSMSFSTKRNPRHNGRRCLPLTA